LLQAQEPVLAAPTLLPAKVPTQTRPVPLEKALALLSVKAALPERH
jgi:hypothetical protein